MKKYLIIGLVIILLISSLLIPKIIKGKEPTVRFKEVESSEIPDQIVEMLPKYIMEERALTCKYNDDIYVIVTRGEKKSKGFDVEIKKIIQEKHDKNKFDLTVFALFEDPNIDEVLPQEYDYPYTIVKTKLKEMPEKVHLNIDYKD